MTYTYQSTDTDGLPCTCVMTAAIGGTGVWHVTDSCGGVWWPSDEAADEIYDANDPASVILEMCKTDPSRGEWRA
jgi:hypothetical protein